MVDAIPPNNSQRALFVGDPENVRETLELTEFEESIPKIMSAMPTASNARPSALFINFI